MRYITLVVMLGFAIVFFGCSKKEQAAHAPAAQAPAAEQAAPAMAEPAMEAPAAGTEAPAAAPAQDAAHQ